MPRRAVLAFAAVLLLLGLAARWVPVGGRTLVARWRGVEVAEPRQVRPANVRTPERGRSPAPSESGAAVRPPPTTPPSSDPPTEDIRAEDRAAVDALMR